MNPQHVTRSAGLGAVALALVLATGCMSDTAVPTGPDGGPAITSARGGIAGVPLSR